MTEKPLLRTLLPALGAALTVAAITFAGPLEPPGPPSASTMKSLNEIPASWHQILPADQDGDLNSVDLPCDSKRFRCEMPRGASGAAVLDLETGLVWQRVPGATAVRWVNARRACYGANTGGRFGWRLPRVAELATLLTPGSSPRLSAGHPFTLGDVATANFWTDTETETNSDLAFSLDFDTDAGPDESDKLLFERVWCVRAPGA